MCVHVCVEEQENNAHVVGAELVGISKYTAVILKKGTALFDPKL